MSVAAAALTPLLQLRGIETFYGKIQALRGVDIDVNKGEIVTLIGANGAGKSTTMMTIFGAPRARPLPSPSPPPPPPPTAGSRSTAATSPTCRRT
jgi:ABC-type ATPase with predicted acetyltransferase domain